MSKVTKEQVWDAVDSLARPQRFQLHVAVPIRTINTYIYQSEQRIRELEVLLIEGQVILTDTMLDEGHSVWMERVDKALEERT